MLNDRQIKSLLRTGKPGRYADGAGLYFRVTAAGTGTWTVRYTNNGKRKEITLAGIYPHTTLADARLDAAQLKAGLRKKIDPLVERNRADNAAIQTVDDLAADWLADCEKRLKHPQIPRRVYEKDLAPSLGQLPLDRVRARDIRAAINKITASGRPTISNDALMYCKQLFRHGAKLDLVTSNPAEAFRVCDAGGIEKSRNRKLTLDELGKVFETFRKYSDQFTRENYLAVALLVVTGVRKGELIGARWNEFDIEDAVWNIPQERSKTGVPISVPIPDEAMRWLDELYVRANGSEFVFPRRRASRRFGHMSPDTLNAAIQKLFHQDKMPVKHITVHDFRRTCRSLLAAEGIVGHVAERCLNHKLKGVEGIYDRYDYMDERREALQKVATLVSPLVAPPSTVTPFRRRA